MASSYGAADDFPSEPIWEDVPSSAASSTSAAKRFMTRDAARRGMPSLLAVSVAFLLPCAIFVGVCASVSFGVANSGLVANLGVLLLAALVGYYVYRAWRKQQQGTRMQPAWHLFLLGTVFATWLAAMVVGRYNFATIAPYYHMGTMNTYVDVDPARTTGAAVMDAGRILFVQGTHLNISRSMGFRSSSMYCVAPIVAAPPAGGNASAEPLSYDFWAVGVGCCSGQQADFKCGEADWYAGAGMRLLDDGQRPYFQMAVQQAEATFGITSTHPVFLRWTKDPILEVNAHREQACQQLIVAIFSFGVFQLFLVAAATVAFAKVRMDSL
eukprot:CAMPEP_0195103270 /NCGR_PEP_ID=MMETSP0448-20130528/71660_1 /TAXON_ID=66468 /ORGANISM="Heterocapsa triquestra, Strain CCMP 448" /LENGTH=325 /DNA_ID=CAMNT_0040138917 /DNA_START=115 /DNA_END=1092 /DNA_ORIENTATION=-